MAGAGLAIPVLVQVARAAYFGVLVPNTGLAKEGARLRPAQGFEYLLVSARDGYLVVLLALLVLLMVRARSASSNLVAPFAAAGLLHLLYVVVVGGDFMAGRLLVPGIFALAIAVGEVRLDRHLLIGATGTIVLAAAISGVARANDPLVGSSGIHDERRYWSGTTERSHPVSGEDFLRSEYAQGLLDAVRRAPPGSLVIWGGSDAIVAPLAPEVDADRVIVAGYLGTAGHVGGPDDVVLDFHGLADPIAAHVRLQERGRPGHEKVLPAEWYLARFAAEDARPATVDLRRVAAARRALTCGSLADLVAATREPLTWARAARNLVEAPRLTTFRFDADPLEAERELCGPWVGGRGSDRG